MGRENQRTRMPQLTRDARFEFFHVTAGSDERLPKSLKFPVDVQRVDLMPRNVKCHILVEQDSGSPCITRRYRTSNEEFHIANSSLFAPPLDADADSSFCNRIN